MKYCKELIVVLLIVKVQCEDYEMEVDSKVSASIDSDSKEIYNYSSNLKPLKRYRVDAYKIVKKDKSTKLPVKAILKKRTTTKKTLKDKTIVKDKKSMSSNAYTVSIQHKNSHYASGALVHKKWILSVAQPFFNVRESIRFYKVRMGTVNCKKGGQSLRLKGIEIHPLYVYGDPNFDLSLIKLAQSVQFTDVIRPIPLNDVDGKIFRANFLVSYWPRLIVQGSVLPSTAKERVKHHSMRISTQPLISREICSNLLHAKNISLEESSLCLEPLTSHHGSCRPDPGAPVVADDHLWGITSGWVASDCITYPSPTIVTRVSAIDVRSWIKSLF